MMPKFSFIVPVRNDAARLQICLRSIAATIAAGGHHEIIVIDNGSEDGSRDVARRFGARVITIAGDVRVSELRNAGARAATGDVFAFVDADNEIVSGWVLAAIESLRQPAVGAVGALYLAPLDGTWVQRAYGYLRGQARGQHPTDWLGSGNLAVWRDAFEAIGGFDTSLDACEDVDFCQRLRGSGRVLISDARMKSVHHGDPETLSDLFFAERWRGRDNIRVSLRGPLSVTALPSALMPIVDVLMLALTAAGLFVALATMRHGMTMVGAAGSVIAASAAVRVLRIVAHDRGVRGLAILQLWMVVFVYNIGRALALVTPAPHRGARPTAASPAS